MVGCNPYERWIRENRTTGLIGIVGFAIVLIIAIVHGCAEGGGTPVRGRVSGHMDHDDVGILTSNSSAFNALNTASVWCGPAAPTSSSTPCSRTATPPA